MASLTAMPDTPTGRPTTVPCTESMPTEAYSTLLPGAGNCGPSPAVQGPHQHGSPTLRHRARRRCAAPGSRGEGKQYRVMT